MPVEFQSVTEPPGTLKRAFLILRHLAAAGNRGAALTDIARSIGLPHPSVHRVLRQLVDERVVMQRESDRRYALGSLTFELGLAAGLQFDLRGLFRPILERLAAEGEGTAYVIVRSGYEAVCLDLQEGAAPIRVVTIQIGSRRPLGVGAGGLAILAALPMPEQQQVMDVVCPLVEERWGMTRELLESSIASARRSVMP